MRDTIKIDKLSSFCKVIAGQSPKGSAYNENGIGVEFHQGKKAFGPHTIQSSNVWTTEITKLAQPGDILMSVRAPVGPTNFTDREVCIGRGLAAIRCKPEVLPQYILYVLKSIESKIVGKDGAVFNSISKDMIEDLPVPAVDKEEQQRIVDILDREFAKIDALKANAEKSLQAAKDLFLQILTETFSNPDWTRKRIGDVFDTGAGGTPLKTYKEYYENGDIPWLRSGEVCKKYITETELFITQLGMDNSSAKMFPENSVVVAMYGATAGQVGILHLETTTNQAVCGIFPRKDYIPEFVYYSLLNSKKGLVAQATGNAQPNISQIKIKNTTIPVISKDKQIAVVSRLDDLNDLCNALQENYHKTLTLCDDLKQSLLRKTFSGEL